MFDKTKFVAELKQKRDELRLQIHLGSMTAKQQWEELEAKWKEFAAEERLQQASEDIEQTMRTLGEDLKKGYAQVKTALAKTMPPAADGERRLRIERLAYELWEQRGRPLGSPEEDWRRAEEIVLSREESTSRAATDAAS